MKLTEKARRYYSYLSLFCIHIIIAAIAFIDYRLDPKGQLFSKVGDGLKNYFTLYTYVKDPIGPGGLFKFPRQPYPFGEYVYYTDNTPLFSIPFRWFCHHIYNLSAYTIPIYNLCVILNIVLCGLLIYYILRHVIKQNAIAYIMAIVLPWANMMVLRIPWGHTSLSLSSLIVLPICLMILWHKHRDNFKKRIWLLLAMCLLSLAAFLTHGYYLAIVTMFTAAMLFFYGLFAIRERQGKQSLIISVIYPVIGVGLSLLLIALTDKYAHIRLDIAQGYDWMEQKTRLSALFSPYSFQQIAFPIHAIKDTTDPEKASYLGNVGLFAVTIIGIIMLLNKRFRIRVIAIQKEYFKDPLKACILLGAMIVLFVAFGENYYTTTSEDGYIIKNILNPFTYLHLFTNRVEQFRSLERFVYPFFFAFNIWVLYTVAVLYQESGKKIQIGILALIIFFSGCEVRDFIMFLQRKAANENLLGDKAISKFKPLHIDYRQYQAILPIPYSFLGSEDYDYTIDDEASWTLYNYQLSVYTGLPLMSCKLSRVPPKHNIELLYLVARDSMNTEMRKLFTDKPVLVAVNVKQLTDSTISVIPKSDSLKKLYWLATQFAQRHHLKAIDSLDGIVFYNWYPHQ